MYSEFRFCPINLSLTPLVSYSRGTHIDIWHKSDIVNKYFAVAPSLEYRNINDYQTGGRKGQAQVSRTLVSAPVPLELIRVLNWAGLGWGWASGGSGLRVWGQGLTIFYNCWVNGVILTKIF